MFPRLAASLLPLVCSLFVRYGAQVRKPTFPEQLYIDFDGFFAACEEQADRRLQGRPLGAEDEGGFPMRLLNFRRTFVEKLFAIHSKVELLKRDGRPIGSYARHYYDLFQLASQPEVVAMLRSDEYAAIKADYDAISRAYFPQSYFCPSEMSFAGSDGLFPQGELARTIAGEYEVQCRELCFGPYPPWEDVQARFEDLRESL